MSDGESNTLPAELLGVPAQEYGAAYKEHVLQQYKLYIESANQVSDRRAGANNYFLTVTTTLVTLYGLAASIHNEVWPLLIALAGILVTIVWHSLIVSYRKLNTVKFNVIHKLETQLPVKLYRYEWLLAEEGRGRSYKPLSHIEQNIPIIFLVVFASLAAFSILRPAASLAPISTKPTASTEKGQSTQPILPNDAGRGRQVTPHSAGKGK